MIDNKVGISLSSLLFFSFSLFLFINFLHIHNKTNLRAVGNIWGATQNSYSFCLQLQQYFAKLQIKIVALTKKIRPSSHLRTISPTDLHRNQSSPSLPNFEEKDNSSTRQSNSKKRKSKCQIFQCNSREALVFLFFLMKFLFP